MEVSIMPQVNIRDFPEELHHKAKILAATEKVPFRELVIRAVDEYVKRAGEPRRKKGG
jgi:hypothetical protein